MDDERGNRRRRHRSKCLRAKPTGTFVASATGLAPTITWLAILTTPWEVPDRRRGSGSARVVSPYRSGWDRSILSEVNHRLESRMREIRLSGLEGGGTDNRFSLSLYC